MLFYILEALVFSTGPRCSRVQYYGFVLRHRLMKHDKHVGTHQKHECDLICCSHPELGKLGHEEGKKQKEKEDIHALLLIT